MSGADDADLRQSIEMLKQDLWKSAQIGKSLLAENEELHGQLEALRKQHSAQTEHLEQEKHVLAMKLTHAAHMESVYCEEIEGLRETMLSQRAAAVQEAEGRHAAEVLQLQAKLAEASSRLKELEAAERAAADEKVALEARLDAAMDLRRQGSHGGKGTACRLDESALSRTATDEEVAAQLKLQQQLDEAVQCQTMLQEHVEQATSRALGAEALARRQAEQIAALREDVEDAQSQATSFGCALERLRLENQDLRAELDMVKLTSQGHKAKGNSMFAELEDKRVGAEMRIVSLLVENKSLAAECEQYRKQLRSVKAQMASVLHMSSGSVDAEHVRQLEQRLADATGRAEELTRALQRCETMEANEASRKLSTVAASCSAATASSVANTASVKGTTSSAAPGAAAAVSAVVDIGYAQSLLKSKDDQLDKLRSELQAKRYELLAESSKLQESQRRQRETDSLVAKLRAENMQLAVRLDEMATSAPVATAAAAPARSTDRTRACTDVAPAGAQHSCDPAGRLPQERLGTAARLPALATPTDEPRPTSSEAAAVSTAIVAIHAARPLPSSHDPGTAVARHLDATAGASSTVTSTVQPDRPSLPIGERRADVAVAAGIGGVANPRTAARLAKMEQSSRQAAAKESVATRLMPKLTARASASDPASSVAEGASQKRHSELTEGPLRKVSGNTPLPEEVNSESTKLEGTVRSIGVLPPPQLSSAGNNAAEDQENCRTQ